MRFFAVAAARGEAPDAADGVTQGQAGGEGVAGAESREMIFPDIPGGGREGSEEATGKNSAGLQRCNAEDIAEMIFVDAPVIDDVEDLGADNSAEHDENAEV